MSLGAISESFALQSLNQFTSARTNLTTILTKSPQTILVPISYNIDNIVPFDVPVYVPTVSSLYILLTCSYVTVQAQQLLLALFTKQS